MKDPHRKGVANHPDLEPCGDRREAAAEAWTEASVARVSSCEKPTLGRRPCGQKGKATQAATTSAALKPPVNRLAPHPQFQCLRLFVQFVPIHPVPRPRQNRRPFFVRQLPSVPKNAISLNHRYLNVFTNSCGELLRQPHCPGAQNSRNDPSWPEI